MTILAVFFTTALNLQRFRGVNHCFPKHHGETALMQAALYGHADIVSLLLNAGADVNAKDEGGDTALMDAASGAPCDGPRREHTDIVRMLLDTGAGINLQNYDGQTALMLAAIYGHTETANVLRNAGARD